MFKSRDIIYLSMRFPVRVKLNWGADLVEKEDAVCGGLLPANVEGNIQVIVFRGIRDL